MGIFDIDMDMGMGKIDKDTRYMYYPFLKLAWDTEIAHPDLQS